MSDTSHYHFLEQPIFLQSGVLSPALQVPTFTYEIDQYTADTMLFNCIIERLRLENLYSRHLVFSGIDGTELHIRGSFGTRSETYGVTELAFKRSMMPKWMQEYNNNPILHMRTGGEKRPALVVFNSRLLECGKWFNEPESVGASERIAWWTRNGESLDRALILVIYFRYTLHP